MTKPENRLVQINIRRLPEDVKERADAEAVRRGFNNATAWARKQIFELAATE